MKQLLVSFLFACITVGLAACVDYSVDLHIKNQTSTGVFVTYTEYSKNGSVAFVKTSNLIPAGQNGTVRTGIINGIAALPKISLQAKDAAGRVIWEQSWTGSEFAKLQDVGWKVSIGNASTKLLSDTAVSLAISD